MKASMQEVFLIMSLSKGQLHELKQHSQVVSGLAFYSDDPSSNPMKATVFLQNLH